MRSWLITFNVTLGIRVVKCCQMKIGQIKRFVYAYHTAQSNVTCETKSYHVSQLLVSVKEYQRAAVPLVIDTLQKSTLWHFCLQYLNVVCNISIALISCHRVVFFPRVVLTVPALFTILAISTTSPITKEETWCLRF